MNFHSLIIAASIVTAVIAGCGRSGPDDDRVQADAPERQLDRATFNAGLDPKDKRIIALVAWLKLKGVTLEYSKSSDSDGRWWRVTEPTTSAEYDVIFSIRSFPSWASEAQMREALDINLAYMLNAQTYLAMSYGGTQGRHAEAKLPKNDDELPKVGGSPVTTAVEQWFMEYKGG